MDDRVRKESYDNDHYPSNVVVHATAIDDEIDLVDLGRNLAKEWKLIAVVMVIGTLISMPAAFYFPKVYIVEAMLRIADVHELGDIKDQKILEITPGIALERVLDQFVAPDVQRETLKNSKLLKDLSDKDEESINRISKSIQSQLSVIRVNRDYYEIGREEKTPFKEIRVTLESTEPQFATEYLQQLIEQVQISALETLTSDIIAIKNSRIKVIKDQLHTLTQAGKESRKVEISRLQEANQELLFNLQQQIDLVVRKAIKDRENQIIRLGEALETAEVLGIKEPVTWDDLRAIPEKSQIINKLGGTDSTAPIYFQGTRILKVELNRLKSRKDERPFVAGLTALEKQVIEIQNDPKIATLKARQDDSIYVENYDNMQRELLDLQQTPTQFSTAQLAVVSQPATVPIAPTRNPMLLVAIGIVLSLFLGLFLALVRISHRKNNLR